MSLVHFLTAWLSDRFRDDRGATMVEYGLMVALVAAISVGVVTILGGEVANAFQIIVDGIPG